MTDGPAPPGLRVLTQLLTTAPAGGIELCTRQDARALVQRGHRVDIACGTDRQSCDNGEAAGITMSGPFPFAFAPRSAPRDIARFIPAARWARSRHADVLWLNRFEHIVWAQVVSRAARIPIVCQLHHVPNYRRVSQLGRGVAHFIAVSDFMRRTWIDGGVAADRISVVHNAVPTAEYRFAGSAERLSASERLGLPGGAVVLYYGRILPDKGVGVLLDAWRRLGLSRRAATLVLVGSPEPQSDAAIAEKVKQVNPATLRWFPMQASVVPFLHAADVVVFPSLMPEGFGRVVIEAMSTGRPVIASRVGAVPEILDGPMARFLAQPGDADDLAAAIDSLLHWRTTEPELAQLCADWVALHFPYHTHVDQLERLLLRYARHRVSLCQHEVRTCVRGCGFRCGAPGRALRCCCPGWHSPAAQPTFHLVVLRPRPCPSTSSRTQTTPSCSRVPTCCMTSTAGGRCGPWCLPPATTDAAGATGPVARQV